MTRTESPSVAIPRRNLLSNTGCTAEPAVVLPRGEYHRSTDGLALDTLARANTHDDADLLIDLSGVKRRDAATVANRWGP